MKVNPKVYEQKLDAFGNIKIPNCSPAELKNVAENIMDMLADLDYSIGRYKSTGELARKITVDYWIKYDQPTLVNGWGEFKEWYLKATKSATIERATRWLIAHNYLLIPADIIQEMFEKEENFRNAVKRK